MLMLFLIPVFGQLPDVLVLSPRVGTEIDAVENAHYDLFPKIPNFMRAHFYRLDGDSVRLVIRYWDARQVTRQIRDYSLFEFYQLGQSLDRQPELTHARRRELMQRFQPLYTNEFIREIPRNSCCIVKRTDQPNLLGNFYKSDENYLYLFQGNTLLTIPVAGIERIRYWDCRQYFNVLYWGVMGCTSALGFTSGIVMNQLLGIKAPQTGLVPLVGMSVGSILGYYIADEAVRILHPKETLEFRKSKLKRLDTMGRFTYNVKKFVRRLWPTQKE